MGIDLYEMGPSPPCTAVRLLAKALDIDLNIKTVNIPKGEHLKAEFIKINPQHSIPTLDDNGFCVWESRAILTYLCEISPKGYTLYPKCPKKRALVNHRLYFDIGTLYARFSEMVYPVIFGVVKEITEAKRTRLDEALKWLDDFLCDGYVAGDTMTVADYSIMGSMAAMEAIGIKLSPYNNIKTWLGKCKATMPGYSSIDESAQYGAAIGGKLKEAGVSL